MKKVKIAVDEWAKRFRDLPDLPGYLPNSMDKYRSDMSDIFEFNPALEKASDIEDVNGVINTQPHFHYLSAVAVSFWQGITCTACHGLYTAHSMVAKHGHLACDQSPNPEIGESGSDNKQVLKPLINFRAIGTGFFLLLKSPRRIDKILLNTWRRIAQEVDASKVLPEKMADVVYAASKEDGRSCWTLHCPHCVVAQPDVWLNPSPSGTVKADAGYAMQIEPHLTVVPTLGNQPSLSGLAFTQLMVRFA